MKRRLTRARRYAEPIEWRQAEAGVEFVSIQSKKKGVELFSNYGAKSNGDLLFMFGFSLDDNLSDTVQVSSPA